eukprot:5692861-Amphidinium_carterae.2
MAQDRYHMAFNTAATRNKPSTIKGTTGSSPLTLPASLRKVLSATTGSVTLRELKANALRNMPQLALIGGQIKVMDAHHEHNKSQL